MNIRVDFYKPSGKWYVGGTVNVGDAKLYHSDFLDIVKQNQEMLVSCDHYIIVTSDLPENMNKPNYTDFFNHLFMPN